MSPKKEKPPFQFIKLEKVGLRVYRVLDFSLFVRHRYGLDFFVTMMRFKNPGSNRADLYLVRMRTVRY